jgi:ribonuclease-3
MDYKLPSELAQLLTEEIPAELLELAFTHPSSVGEGLERTLKSNQRLEFLGDAIVGAAVAEHWYRTQPNLPEGELTQRKAAVVQKKTLAAVAAQLNLDTLVKVGRGADAMSGRGRDAILADAFEALVGALFLAHGWEVARDFILRALEQPLKVVADTPQTANVKNLLQEYTQSIGLGTPTYHSKQIGGPAHALHFAAEVLLQGQVRGNGEGHSKKEAECRAAQTALEQLQNAATLLAEQA